MQQAVTTALWALLRFALAGKEIGNVKRVITPDVLPPLLTLAKKHDLAHLVGDALDKNGLLPDGDAMREKFKHEFNLAVYRRRQQSYEFERICCLLEKGEIPFVPLKGSVTSSYYPEAWMRTSCDIDILVPEDKLPSAVDALTGELGFTVQGPKGVHDISLRSESGVHLELHFSLKQNYAPFDAMLERVWEFCRECDGYRFRRQMTQEFFYLHTLLHTAYHLVVGGGCGLRSILDVFFLERTGCDGGALLSLCRECGADTFYQKIRQLSNTCMTGGEFSEEEELLLEYISCAGMYGDTANRVAVQHVKKRGKLRYLLSRLILPYDELVARYPAVRRRALIPWYQVVRWFALLFGENAKKFRKQLASSVLSGEKDRARTERILDILAL